MFHGHFAAGLLLKAIYGPSIPACPAMMGSSFLDIIGGLDALLGLTVITPSSARGPYMYSTFTFIDWEHSALMMLIWSSIFGWAVCHHHAGFSKEASMLRFALVDGYLGCGVNCIDAVPTWELSFWTRIVREVSDLFLGS